MSIINIENTIENGQLVYCNIDNIVIECICLDKLSKYIENDYVNEGLGIFICDKIKIITVYDIYKKIIYKPVKTYLFKKLIKINDILENLKKESIFFFKTFIGTLFNTFIQKRRLNGMQYFINHKGDITDFMCYNFSLKIINSMKFFNIYNKINNDEIEIISTFHINEDCIVHINNSDYKIKIYTYNKYIRVSNYNYQFGQKIIITFNKKNLKIYKIEKYVRSTEIYVEERNDNNEIVMYKEYNNIKNINKKFYFNNTNPSFSKPLKKYCIESINYYKENIINIIKQLNYLFKKEKKAQYNLLLHYNLEIINSK